MLIDAINKKNPFTQTTDGLLVFYDASRSMNISITRQNISFGINHKSISSDRFLYATGSTQTYSTGYRIYRNGVVTAMSIQSSNNASATISLRKNNLTTSLYDLQLNSESGKSVDNLNVLLSENDWLQVYIHNITLAINYPIVTLEMAWR